MAVGHGLAGVIKIGVNTVLQVQNIRVSQKTELASKAVMGDIWDSFLPGLNTGTLTADTLRDPADTTGQQAMTLQASATLNVYPQGTATGKKYLIVPVIIESIDDEIQMGGVVKRSFGARINAAVTEGTA